MSEPLGSPVGFSTKFEFVLGVCLGLVPWGLGLIGLTVNLWLGCAVLSACFVLIAHAFFKWATARRWGMSLRWGVILTAAVGVFILIGRQAVSQYRLEHPAPERVAPSPSPAENGSDFHAELEYALKSPGYANTKHPLLSLFVYIRNTGTPSTVAYWGLEIDRPGKTPLMGTSGIPDRDITVQLGPNKPTKRISRSESLAYKVGSNPIQKGGGAGGILFFALNDLETDSYADIFPPGTTMKLSFRDSVGKLYNFTFLPKGLTDELMIMPGMNVESVTSPQTKRRAKR